VSLSALDVDWLAVVVLSFIRLYGFMYFFPLISGEQVPAMVRAVLCMALTPFLAFPLLDSGAGALVDTREIYLLLFKEAAFGAFLGLVTGLPLRLPEIIGGMIDNQRGTAVTDTYNPTSGSDASLLGQLLSLTLVVYFFTAGGLDQLVLMLGGSFKLLPISSYVPTVDTDIWQVLLEMFTRYLGVFAILTLPVMVAMFLAEIALAVASRFAQSLNVFSLAQPIKALVAISLLVTMMPRITHEVMTWLNEIMVRFGL
jgi:type III secretion protein T